MHRLSTEERFLVEFILSMAEGLGMTVEWAVIPNEVRDLGQIEPRPTDDAA
jgi:hypothetical protein